MEPEPARYNPPMLRDTLERGLEQIGVMLPASAVEALLLWTRELLRWNRAYNLTAVRDPESVVERHLLDALAVLPLLRERLSGATPRLLDVGSGPGVPGLILAVAWPELEVTTIDSVGKKVRFQRHVARQLGLSNLCVLHGRIERVQADRPWPAITSRAFAALPDFIRLTMPLLAPGGVWLAMKARIDERELDAARPMAPELSVHALSVPGAGARHLVVAARSAGDGAGHEAGQRGLQEP